MTTVSSMKTPLRQAGSPPSAALADILARGSDCPITDDEFQRIRELIYREAGISLSEAKRALVCSRLAKRLRQLKLRSYGEYLDYLAKRDDGSERQIMVNCLTTNKTDFFREPHHFTYLRDVVFPQIQRRAERGGPRRVRIWSAGCSIGHEPYTIAVTMLEHFRGARGWDLRILASDINTQVLETAARGIYPLEHIDVLDPALKSRYFLRGNGQWDGSCQVRPEVRRLVTFRQINFMEPTWPLTTRFDVIFCRNVIIYFDLATQERLTLRFGGHLNDGGYLMLGHSEHPHWLEGPFHAVGQTVYKKLGNSPYAPDTAGEESVRPVGQRTVPAAPFRGTSPASRLRSAASAPRTAVQRAACAGEAPCNDSSVCNQCSTFVQDNGLLKSPCAKGAARPAGCRLLGGKAPRLGITSVPRRELNAGQYFASREPTEVTTFLGSCVAACLYDPQTRIAGMNHFLLPYQATDPAVSARYGVHAMELLINEIMKLGGDRRQLRAKVFGGCNVLNFSRASWNVGDRNNAFIHQFLAAEKIPIVAERCGGNSPLRVHFRTDTAQAFVKALGDPAQLIRAEEQYSREAALEISRTPSDNVTLF